jgi:hypothetical protein
VIDQATLAPFRRGGRLPRAAAAESLRVNLLRFAAFELAVWASLYAAYLAVRGATIGSPDEALRNGREIVAAENALRIFHEARVQEALSALEWFFSAYYMVGFAPLIALTLVWLALRHVHRYRELRTALLVSISVATVVFVLFPAAPPRLIPDLGIADTVGLSSHDTGSFAGVRFNPYAAMPSMHVGWSLLVGLAGYRAARRRVTRGFFALHPAVMVVAVMATGNHFVLDAVAGAAIAVAVHFAIRVVRRHTSSEAKEADMFGHTRSSTHATPPRSLGGPVLLRRSVRADTAALRRLAALDSRPLPRGTFLLAEVGDALVAAVPLDVDESPIADPFEPTEDVCRLLRVRARQLRTRLASGGPRRPVRVGMEPADAAA